MFFRQITDPKLAQYAYIIGCQQTGEAIVIDPERDIDRYIDIAEQEGLKITAAADTHIHADYISGLREFAERGVLVYASDEGGDDWRYEWLRNSKTYCYDLLTHGDTFEIGNIKFKSLHTPGHTPEHISFLVTDSAASSDPMGLLSGDFVFVGDVGRPDLLDSAAGYSETMKPAAKTLYKSIQNFKDLPEYLQVWPAHGAGSACGKALGAVPDSTVGYELRNNASIEASNKEDRFVDYILTGQPEPPLYFGRMKRDNKKGPAVLGTIPDPPHLDFEQVEQKTADKKNVVIDTRSINDFMNGHLPNSLLAPFNKSFPTVAGSYVGENDDIFLICDQRDLHQIVLNLIRIGLDNIVGYITPESFKQQWENDRRDVFENINTIHFNQTPELVDEGAEILDVRKKAEFDQGYIPGAINIAHTRLADSLDQLDTGTTYLVHCRMGGRSAVASAYLKRMGYPVYFIDDFIVDHLKTLQESG